MEYPFAYIKKMHMLFYDPFDAVIGIYIKCSVLMQAIAFARLTTKMFRKNEMNKQMIKKNTPQNILSFWRNVGKWKTPEKSFCFFKLRAISISWIFYIYGYILWYPRCIFVISVSWLMALRNMKYAHERTYCFSSLFRISPLRSMQIFIFTYVYVYMCCPDFILKRGVNVACKNECHAHILLQIERYCE